ncbi:RidA family protein [Herbaspirillum sp. DW155]|uniref:RidA family protein n=1 Tax=Herbaspirillum sp. DW155 TaxID=3095609 RepID=UPI0018ED235C|nr:RidA family protein [Herbaspirillum sp. ASV7]BEV14347.1 RidA family protein [Herbaspirillum sp. DW155]
MSDIQRKGGSARFSQIVVHNGTVYLAGQVSQLTGADIREQAKDVFTKIDSLLAKADSNKGRLLSATIWLVDMQDYDQLNQEWDAWLAGHGTPVRACVAADLAKPHYRVEVQVTAAMCG